MKVHIKDQQGVTKTLDTKHIIENSYGYYIAQDQNGDVFKYLGGKPIKFNIADREGVGLLNGVEYTYEVEGYLNDKK